MAKYYIAGPMTGYKNFNRDLFNQTAAKLTTEGHSVLNPATLPDGLTQSEYMRICVQMVFIADRLMMLPGWKRSAGATAEHGLALKLGKEIDHLWRE